MTVQADRGVSLAPVSSRNPGGAAAGSLGMHALVLAAMLAGLSPQQSAIDAGSAIAGSVETDVDPASTASVRAEAAPTEAASSMPARASSAGASAVVAPARNTLMAAWLAANRRYPDEAGRRNEDREVTVAHDGRVSAARFASAALLVLRLFTDTCDCRLRCGPAKGHSARTGQASRPLSAAHRPFSNLPNTCLASSHFQLVPNKCRTMFRLLTNS